MTPRVASDTTDASPLGKPLHFEFSGRTAPNRFLKAAMTERISSWDPKNMEARGIPSDQLINVYKRWGEGGLGHILTGNIMVGYDQLEAAGNPIIPPDAPFEGPRFEAFAKLASAAKAKGSLISGQVSHPGRQVEIRIQSNPVSASDVQLEGLVLGMNFAKPHAASQDEIKDLVKRFTHAAEFLHKAGYDGIQACTASPLIIFYPLTESQLHGAHGYLLAQFLSKTTNKRTDQYGGALENRARIILEIADSIKAKLPASFIVGIKINSKEFQEGGFSEDEAGELCQLLERHEFDYVELSGGTYQSLAFEHKRESTKKREAFFLEFAERIVPGLSKTKTYITGGFQSLGAMVKALDTVDGVGLGRPVCQEPRLANDLLQGRYTGAIDQQVDKENFGLTSVIGGSQIRQIGKDQEPINMGSKDNVAAFLEDMGKWGQKIAENAQEVPYGYVDIESVKADAYGTVQA